MKKLFALGLASFFTLSTTNVYAQNTSLNSSDLPIEIEFNDEDNEIQDWTFFDVRHTGGSFTNNFTTGNDVVGTNLNIFVQNNTAHPINFIVGGFGTQVVPGFSSSTRSFSNAHNRQWNVTLNSSTGNNLDINARARQFR